MLEARGIGYRAGSRWILRHVDLSIDPGEMLCLAGPNGAGKSTLLRVLSGELAPAEGTVTFKGKDLRQWDSKSLACSRAYFQQHRGFFFPFTVREMVLLGRIPHLHGRGERMDDLIAAANAMDKFGVSELADRMYATLSGGEAARVDLARVLAQEPSLFLLDEPTNHLDLTNQYSILDVCRNLAANGAAIIAVLHDLNLSAGFAHRIALMHEGGLIACGVPWSILTPERINAVYNMPCQIWTHPDGHPWVVPTPSG